MITSIETTNVWSAGANVPCDSLSLESVSDNLESCATVHYKVGKSEKSGDENDGITTYAWAQDGSIVISGVDYQNWNTEEDANAWLVMWTLKHLNLIPIK
jgi:hypothetical protein